MLVMYMLQASNSHTTRTILSIVCDVAVRRMHHIGLHYKHLVQVVLPPIYNRPIPCFKTGTLHFFGVTLPNIDRFSKPFQ